MTLLPGNKDVNKDMVGPRPTRSGGGLDRRGFASYCPMSCPAYNSPFMCDAQHTQDIPLEGSRSKPNWVKESSQTYNHLVDAVLKVGSPGTL